LALVAVAGMGCNPLTMPFFFMYGAQSKHSAEFQLVTSKDTPARVVILTTYPGYVPEEFIGIERNLGAMFEQQLVESCALNKERVEVVPLAKVERYKSETPQWSTANPSVIGTHFEADYVIELTINSMSLFDQGSRHLYNGRAAISVEVFDAKKPNGQPVHNSEYTVEFPPGRPVPADEMPVSKFRLQFLKRIATDLSWKFSDHLVEETYGRKEF